MSSTSSMSARSRTDASATPGSATSTIRLPPDILTYCYGSQMVYVTPGEDYDRAIDIAVEAFPELDDVDRDWICLEVRVTLGNQHDQKTAKISRKAWSVVVARLARFEIVEIRVAPLPKYTPKVVPKSAPKSAVTPSSSVPSLVVVEPSSPSETDWYPHAKGSQTTLVPYRQQISSPLSGSRSHTHRVIVDFVTPQSSLSRGCHCPQPCLHQCF